MVALRTAHTQKGDAKNLCVEYRAENKGKDMKAILDYFEELKRKIQNSIINTLLMMRIGLRTYFGWMVQQGRLLISTEIAYLLTQLI
jgi:hypothetical protein